LACSNRDLIQTRKNMFRVLKSVKTLYLFIKKKF